MGVALVRLADLLAGLSRLADLGFGLQSGEALRSAALAAMVGRSLGLPDQDVRAALYTALLHHVGCSGYAHEAAQVFADELTMYAASQRTNLADRRDVITTFLPALTQGRPPLERAKLTLAALTRGRHVGEASSIAACEVGQEAARRLGLPEEVQRSIYHSYEWWNGGGVPAGLIGEDIPVGARVAVLTGLAVTFEARGGVETAVEAVRQQSGSVVDPGLVDHLAGRADALFGDLSNGDPHAMVLDAEPRPVVSVLDPEMIDVATVFGDLADLKSPYTHGHSRGVATLVRGAWPRLGLSEADAADLEVAALLHDVGRVAISTSIWDKPEALSAHEWEQVRLHAYHSERILAGSERLAPLAPLVGMHHERSDGSGYHRGCAQTDLPLSARVLAAADAYQAMTQRRAHRPAMPPERAEEQLLADVRSGRLDPDAVSAVLAAAGHDAVVARATTPAGLTPREVEVLGLVAEGCSNPQIARRLVISRRTAEQHVQNVYSKIGVSSRAAAALFAMEQDLLVPATDIDRG